MRSAKWKMRLRKAKEIPLSVLKAELKTVNSAIAHACKAEGQYGWG